MRAQEPVVEVPTAAIPSGVGGAGSAATLEVRPLPAGAPELEAPVAAPDADPLAPSQVVFIPHGPVGTQRSYVFALDVPELMGWADDDVVVFVEDDYLLSEDAFVALAEAAAAIPEAGYFALGHGRPADMTNEAECRAWSIVPWWTPRPDVMVGGRTWTNILGVTSTFAARVGALREDRDIFERCRRPFRKRWLDHETAMLYQGVVPYRGASYFFGSHGDFEPGLRGVARAIYLLPFRVELNRRARAQRAAGTQKWLYSPRPVEAAHLETHLIEDLPRWENEARAAVRWAREVGYHLAGHEAEALGITL